MTDARESIRVLIVEDSPDDAELLERELRRGGYEPTVTRVDCRGDLSRAPEDATWDIVLSDFSMPSFTGAEALEQVRAAGSDVPFIVVSGSIGEEVAVEAMKAGAQDYFRKDNLKRLGAAVQRELLDAKVRRERAAALRDLGRAEERHRLLIENVRDHAIFMLDAHARVVSWGRGAQRITGYSEGEILGERFDRFFDDADRAAGVPEQTLLRAREESGAEDEGFRIRKDGSAFWASSSVNSIGAPTELAGYSVVFRDSTQRKQLLDDLRLAVQARDDFLSVASHELRTPLASLVLQLGVADRLLRAHPTSVPSTALEPKFSVLNRQVERIVTLVDHLLDVARITSGRLVLSKTQLELADAVRGVVRRFHESIERSGSRVTVFAPEPVVGLWDPSRIDGIMAHLLSNALKYGQGKPVEVTVQAARGIASLTVTDRGIGIPATAQERIFLRFERAVPVQHYGGFGIGLWVVRQLAEAHGGGIRVESREGVGSSFTVTLPLGG